MKRESTLTALLLILITGLLVGACDDDGLRTGSLGQIETFPRERIAFSKVSIGDTQFRILNITNVGTGPLTLFDIQWDGTPDISINFAEGSFSELTLQPDEVYEIQIAYAPTLQNPGVDEGFVVIDNSDGSRPEHRVEVVSADLGPRIQVTPPQSEGLNFGQVARDQTDTRTVIVTNVGELPLIIDEIQLSGSSEFALDLPSEVTFPYTIADTTEELRFNVSYSPNNLGEDQAEVVILSNDAITPEYELPIISNSSSPCIQLSTNLVEFDPPVGIGDARTEVVTIRSCGPVDLEIESFSKTADSSSEILSFEPTPLAGLVLEQDETVNVEIIYTPSDEGVDAAEFLIRSNAVQSEVTLRALGNGTSNQCPTADLQARVAGSPVLTKQVAAIPLDVIVLDATNSSDSESAVTGFTYTLTDQPDGSTAVVEDEGNGRARLFLDLAGDYEVCLDVEDEKGTPSCNTDCIQVKSKPNEKIHVQLIWRTEKDPVIGDDDGADLDLHFTRIPEGSWGDRGSQAGQNGWDVFFLNTEPTWLITDGLPENPSLDIDDRDGEGPENVNLDDPNPCSWYAIGVHYFDDKGLEDSFATIRVFINGQRRFEKFNIPFLLGGVSSGDFWYVGLIHWDGSTGRVFEVAEKYSGDSWVGLTPTVPQQYLDFINDNVAACAE